MDPSGLYRGVVEGSPDGIWVIDLHGRTAYTNPAMAAMYGVGPDEMTSVSMFDSLDDLGKVQLDEHLRQLADAV